LTYHVTKSQKLSLLFLRVATGFLLIWIGLRRIVNGSAPGALRDLMELGDAATNALGYAAGGIQLAIGVFCVIGLWRRVVLPLQALIHGFTAASVWWAIIDPYRWYISGVDRIVFNSHVFYPTIITFAACLLLIAFRRMDHFSVDHIRAQPDSTG
jgi:uncharacterized membrane protein YphA (DoxX/SURF4 family)